jgi:integrase
MPGTLRELPRSKRHPKERRWEIRVYVGRDPDKTVVDDDGHVVRQGPPMHVSKVIYGGKRDALAALDDLVAETEKGMRVGVGATVGKLLTAYLADLERLGKARATLLAYKMHVAQHIRPGLGHIRLDKLGVQDVDRYLGELAAKGLAPRTIKLDHAVLSAALSRGVDWRWIKGNPAKGAKLRPPEVKPTKPFTAAHVAQLYQAAIADEDIDMAMVVALGAITGCRRGELAGLKWDDLDTDRCCLRVERQWAPADGGQELKPGTKSGIGRTVYIGPDGVKLLDRYREAKQEQCGGREPEGWLISLDGGETPMRVKAMTEYIGRLAKRLGVPGHLHTLRHWKQTEMNRLGVDLPTAADQGGHTIGVMAETYLHTSDDRASAAGELVSAVVVKAISD